MLHPLILAVAVVDLCALALLIPATWTAIRVVRDWSPGAADRRQLALERRAEAASLQGRIAWGLLLGGGILFVTGIASILPDLVPGAMCGTGVDQATRGGATRAIAVRGLAFAALSAWHLLERLDASVPTAPLRRGAARLLLVATPLVALSIGATLYAYAALDTYGVVECCTVAYDALALRGGIVGPAWLPDALLLWAFGGGALVLAAGGAWLGRTSPIRAGLPFGLALAVLVWVPLSYLALIRVLAAYHYEVLAHHCPWCLFLGEHHLVGYPLFAALAWVALEGPAAALAWEAGRQEPTVAPAAMRRVRRAGVHLVIATLAFVALAAGPALVWRLRFGVWMG
ncbi:MAG: hypothetical protein JRI25_16850 [Deltaproteobacteria bacterium]|nr:hypothetical protein [Deltaproteobacteria bacterium]